MGDGGSKSRSPAARQPKKNPHPAAPRSESQVPLAEQSEGEQVLKVDRA